MLSTMTEEDWTIVLKHNRRIEWSDSCSLHEGSHQIVSNCHHFRPLQPAALRWLRVLSELLKLSRDAISTKTNLLFFAPRPHEQIGFLELSASASLNAMRAWVGGALYLLGQLSRGVGGGGSAFSAQPRQPPAHDVEHRREDKPERRIAASRHASQLLKRLRL